MVLVDNIIAYCDKQQISKYEFERRCGLSKSLVRKWESRENPMPSYATLLKIETATGIPVANWMMEGGIGKGKHRNTN